MTPEQERKLNEVVAFMKQLKRYDTIPLDVERGFAYRLKRFFNAPEGLNNAPFDAVGSPTAGMTVDTEARAAIDAIITTLEAAGILEPN